MSDEWASEYMTMIEDCEKRSGKLSEWELGFIDSLSKQIGKGGSMGFDEAWARNRLGEIPAFDPSRLVRARLIELASEAYERGLAEHNQSASILRDGIERIDWRTFVRNIDESIPLADRPASSMTIRERFAMAAMQGFCATVLNDEGQWNDAKTIADSAVDVAKNLIAVLKSKP